MNDLLLIYFLSTIAGIVGTYFLIKTAVKHGVEAANKKPEIVKGKSEDKPNDKITKNDLLIGLGFLFVFAILFFSGVLD